MKYLIGIMSLLLFAFLLYHGLNITQVVYSTSDERSAIKGMTRDILVIWVLVFGH